MTSRNESRPRKPNPDGESRARPVLGPEPAANPVGQTENNHRHLIDVAESSAQGLLTPDTSRTPTTPHRSRIMISGESPQRAGSARAQHRSQRAGVDLGELTDRADAEPVETGCGNSPHTPQRLHRQGVKKRQLGSEVHHHQTIGFGACRSDLGQELGGRDPNREWQSHLVPDPPPHLTGDV